VSPRPLDLTLFPYTTLFRSRREQLLEERSDCSLAFQLARHVEGHHTVRVEVDQGGVEAPVHGLPALGGQLARALDRVAQPLRGRSEEHTSELQPPDHLVCRL